MGDDPIRDGNRDAWNVERYGAWVDALGEPADAASAVAADPAYALRRLLPHLGDLNGRQVLSVQGSHGRVGLAMTLLGAKVTIADFSEENRRFALAMAEAAGVSLDYQVMDILQVASLGRTFERLVLELGILHYHRDLAAFFGSMSAVAAPGAVLVLNEFHPAQRKIAWEHGPHDYFHAGLVVAPVPDPTGQGRRLGDCTLRFWTLGEIISALIAAGFRLDRLEEHPDWDNPKIAGTFTVVATRVS